MLFILSIATVDLLTMEDRELGDNEFTGSIPPELGQLTLLNCLYVHQVVENPRDSVGAIIC